MVFEGYKAWICYLWLFQHISAEIFIKFVHYIKGALGRCGGAGQSRGLARVTNVEQVLDRRFPGHIVSRPGARSGKLRIDILNLNLQDPAVFLKVWELFLQVQDIFSYFLYLPCRVSYGILLYA